MRRVYYRRRREMKFKPKTHQYYYCINAALVDVDAVMWSDSDKDKKMLAIGNCFATKEEAEQMLDKFKLILKGLDKEEAALVKDSDYCWYPRYGVLAEVEKRYYSTNPLDEGAVTIKYRYKAKTINETVPSDEVREIRTVPYSEYEMQALVGKVVTYTDGWSALVTQFRPSEGLTDNTQCHKCALVKVGDEFYTSPELMSYFTVDGGPCGRVEILE
jgi:hypothetical protein